VIFLFIDSVYYITPPQLDLLRDIKNSTIFSAHMEFGKENGLLNPFGEMKIIISE